MFHTILFDIDGVMLSEERYFDASALTVYELLCSANYLGLADAALPKFRAQLDDAQIAAIRRAVFAEESALETMKQRGVNANWDMVYLQVAYQLSRVLEAIRQTGQVNLAHYRDCVRSGWTQEALRGLHMQMRRDDIVLPSIDFLSFNNAFIQCRNKADMFALVDQRLAAALPDAVAFVENRSLWNLCQSVFQEWYLGCEYVPSTTQPGKRGFLADELPLVDPNAFSNLLAMCKRSGVTIGIGTGRPRIETEVPLAHFGWLSYFDSQRVSTASDVLQAEQVRADAAPLSKPHPYSYLRSLLAVDDVVTVLDHKIPLPVAVAEGVLVVGDSVADALAAKALGCRFAAVLTGLEGHKARTQFEQLEADYIFDDVLGVQTVLQP